MSIVLFGFGLGLALAASPGPVTIIDTRLGLQRGFEVAWAFELGSCADAAIWGVLGLTGLTVLAEPHWVRVGLGMIGVALLADLAWGSFRTALGREQRRVRVENGRASARRLFAGGAAVALANPLQLVFWLASAGTLRARGVDAQSPARLMLFLGAFVTATLVWGTGFALLVGRGRRFVGPRTFRAVGAASAFALGGFASYLAVNTARLALGA
jgi:threonine/homoserine/homoserine lactone efflux protein